jgi:hypothetical protein
MRFRVPHPPVNAEPWRLNGPRRRESLLPRLRRRHWAQLGSAVVTLAVGLRAMPSIAQDVTSHALKAAFIYNLARFTAWPAAALPERSPLTLCVAGDPAVADALERTVKNRHHEGHAFVVSQVTPGVTSLRACHVVFIGSEAASTAARLVAEVKDAPVLTIGDLDNFGQLGGIAQLYFNRGQLHLYVHTENMARTRLAISSRVLALSKRP